MSNTNPKAIEGILAIIKEMKLKQELSDIVYRPDYEDYQLLFGDTHHCEIQEKIINDVIVFKNGDAKRQIQYLLNHLIAWAEWEKPGQSDTVQEDKMSLDDDI